jgi:hypothetical protein
MIFFGKAVSTLPDHAPAHEIAQDASMFEQAVEASKALQDATHNPAVRLFPALAGCDRCRTVHMVATAVLTPCAECGADLDVLHSTAPAMQDN